MKKFIIFDGNSVINRAFYGVPLLSTKQGIYTNAVYGFLNILIKYLTNDRPDYLAVAFDVREKTFRHKKYDGYKAQRKGMPEELAMQMPILKRVLSAMNIEMIEMPGYEADDIIGTVAEKCGEKGIECIITTGDRDSFQLASENTSVYLTSTRMGKSETKIITPETIMEMYGVTPKKMIDIKSLMGDSSDNIPGVSGIGEKTAVKLIGEYGSLGGVYENIDTIKGATKTKLEAGKEMAYLSYELAEIFTKVPIEFDVEKFALKDYDKTALAEIFNELEFTKLFDKLGIKNEKPAAKKELKPQIIEDRASAEKAIKEITALKEFAYNILNFEGEICTVSVSSEDRQWVFLFKSGLFASLVPEDIKDIFTCGAKKTTHSLKEDIVILKDYGILPQNIVFDTSLASYVVNPIKNSYDIGGLMGFETMEEKFGKGKKAINPTSLPLDEISEYGALLAASILELKEELSKVIKERNQDYLYYEIELPLAYVLADMEQAGFKVDRAALTEFGKIISQTIDITAKSIYELAGEEFNINSPKQLGEVLFEKLELPVIRKTKTGYSTDADVLDKLSGKHEIIGQISSYRMLSKLKSTYIDGMLPLINPADGKIHSKFNQTVTATGRISSTEPNLQNIPVRTEIGSQLRKMFVAKSDEYTLLDADYSQIELRILAHISKDEVLTEAFKNGDDVHTITASQVFHVAPENVTPQMRSNAKAVNFGIIYGISDFALAGDLHVSKKTAGDYINGYLDKYPGVRQYMADTVAFAKENGYVSTIFGRRRDIPELKSQKYVERSFGERVALNTPIQGSSADIIKLAMVKVYRALKEGGYKSRLILQVHDELIVEAHKDEIKEVKEILKKCMESVVELTVPIPVDVGEGESWYEAK